MKNITYTQLRSDLSATLESLRSGESVKVTQRGKPDIVISAKQADKAVSTIKAPAGSEINTQLAQIMASNMSPQVKEGVMNLTRQLNNLIQSDEAKQAISRASDAVRIIQMRSESFLKALEHTQTKHAEIIKKLEDK